MCNLLSLCFVWAVCHPALDADRFFYNRLSLKCIGLYDLLLCSLYLTTHMTNISTQMHSEGIWMHTDARRMRMDSWGCTWMHGDSRGCMGMHTDAYRCPRMHMNAYECIKDACTNDIYVYIYIYIYNMYIYMYV